MLVIQIIGMTMIFITFFIAIGYIIGMRINHTSDNISNEDVFQECKRIFNGEENDGQLFFINKDDVTDIKLAYELISAQKAADHEIIDYNTFVIDHEDKYYEYKITYNNKDNELDLLRYINKDDEDDLISYHDYHEMIKIRKYINKKLNEFMQNSKINDIHSLIVYYKSIIETKKLNYEEAKDMTLTYFSMVDQVNKLNVINKNEAINEEINKTNKTFGFDQSKLKKELDILTKNN